MCDILECDFSVTQYQVYNGFKLQNCDFALTMQERLAHQAHDLACELELAHKENEK